MPDEREAKRDTEARIAAAVMTERESCARLAAGWQTHAADDDYMTSGYGRYWDPDTMYAQGRMDAGADIRARPAPDVAHTLAALLAEAEARGMRMAAEAALDEPCTSPQWTDARAAEEALKGRTYRRILAMIPTQPAGGASDAG